MRTLILTLTLLVTSSAAWAQLTDVEAMCRFRGKHIGNTIALRRHGWTLTDLLLRDEHQFKAEHLPQDQRDYYHGLTRMAYGLSDLTPEQASQLAEGVCLEIHTERARTQSAMNRKAAPKRKTQDHFIRDPRPY